jgi:hypothetical protein
VVLGLMPFEDNRATGVDISLFVRGLEYRLPFEKL